MMTDFKKETRAPMTQNTPPPVILMELNIATLNVRGLQSKGSWRQFIKQMIPWARRHRINALCIQEHNLQKSRKEQLKYDAHEVGWNLIIGFAAARSARGGCAILLLKEIEVEAEHEISDRT